LKGDFDFIEAKKVGDLFGSARLFNEKKIKM
jgi:hypothetical protein